MPRIRAQGTFHILAKSLWAIGSQRAYGRVIERDDHRFRFVEDLRRRLHAKENARQAAGEGAVSEILDIQTEAVLRLYLKKLEEAGIIRIDKDHSGIGRPFLRIIFEKPSLDEVETLLNLHFPLDVQRVLPPLHQPKPDISLEDIRAVIKEELRKSRENEEAMGRAKPVTWHEPAPAIAPVPTLGTVFLVDLDNACGSLGVLHGSFPGREVLKRVNETCPPIRMALIFYNKFGIEDGSRLRQMGFRLIRCPPLESGTKDTVDETIIEFGTFWLRHPDISHVVLFSGDGGYEGLVDRVRNAGSEFRLFAANRFAGGLSQALIRKVGTENLIELTAVEDPDVKYQRVVQRIIQSREVPEDPQLFRFIQYVFKKLPDLATAKYPRRAFFDMVRLIAIDIRGNEFTWSFSENEVRGLLTAFNNAGAFLIKQQDAIPPRYYVFNTNAPNMLIFRQVILGL